VEDVDACGSRTGLGLGRDMTGAPRARAQVEDVDASRLTPDAGAAIVTARLREAGDLYAATGKRSEGHCYDNAYTVEYTLARALDGGWRIADALVTGTT